MLSIDNFFISKTIVQLIIFTFIDFQINDFIDKIVILSISHFFFDFFSCFRICRDFIFVFYAIFDIELNAFNLNILKI